jgi:hypothetical protein
VSRYIEFSTDTSGLTILVETDQDEVVASPGVEKAGLFPRKAENSTTVAVAKVSFGEAVQRVVTENAKALTDAIKQLAEAPAEVEMKFALKATGEAGNIAIARVGGEATFELRLLWKKQEA